MRASCIVAAFVRRGGIVIVLIGGGVRSGKSRFALERAQGLGRRRAFVATATASDAEMAARIAAHLAERGDAFRTVEAPLALCETLRELAGVDVAVIDCLTLWLANLLLAERSDDAICAEVESLATTLQAAPFHAVLVTNEVGMGVVPESALGRRFRDVAGNAHQRLAKIADEIYFGVLGLRLQLHPGPVRAL